MNKKGQSIEALLEELQQTLDRMSSDDIDIEQSIKEYAKAAELIQKCQERLDEAKLQIQEIDERIITPEAEDGF